MTYVRMIEDSYGDLVDIEHYCSAACFTKGTGKSAYDPPAYWPCPEQADYPQYCPVCEEMTVTPDSQECRVGSSGARREIGAIKFLERVS